MGSDGVNRSGVGLIAMGNHEMGWGTLKRGENKSVLRVHRLMSGCIGIGLRSGLVSGRLANFSPMTKLTSSSKCQ